MLLLSMLLVSAQSLPVSQSATPAEDKVMCRLMQEPSSRIPLRVCRKNSEWEQMEREVQEELRSSRNNRTSGRSGTIVNSAQGFITPPGN